MTALHPHVERLAEHAEGLLGAEASAEVDAHLEQCAECRDRSGDLGRVQALLAGQGLDETEPVPELIARRVQRALREEAGQRADRHEPEPALADRSPGNGESLELSGRAPETSPAPRRTRRWPRVLVAAAAVVVVAFGAGELLTGVSGLDSGADAERGSAGAFLEDAPPAEVGEGRDGAQSESLPGRTQAEGEGDDRLRARKPRPSLDAGGSIGYFFRRNQDLEPRRYREDCVGQALNDMRWRGYSYRFVRNERPAVVSVEPSGGLYEISIIHCRPSPRVLVSGRLPDPS